MLFKKRITSIIISALIFLDSFTCFAQVVPKYIPDKDIIIDSKYITSLFDNKIAQRLGIYMRLFPSIGKAVSKISGPSEKKGLRFTEPDKNSDNPLEKELFPQGSPNPEDVQQKNMELNCFLAVLSTVAERNPQLLKNSLVDNNDGTVTVKFFNPNDGSPMYIQIQKTIPDLPLELKFLKNDCLWVHMYLKAFVASGYAGIIGYIFPEKNFKNYKHTESGKMDIAVRMITGKDTKKFNRFTVYFSGKDSLYEKIEKTLNSFGYVVCNFSTPLSALISEFGSKTTKGIIRHHAYSIEKVYKDEEGARWVMLKTPWNNNFSPARNRKDEPVSHINNNNKGYVTLKFEDFQNECGEICFSINKEKISNRGLLKRLSDLIDPAPQLFLFAQIFIIGKFKNSLIKGASKIIFPDKTDVDTEPKANLHQSAKVNLHRSQSCPIDSNYI